MYNSEEEFLKAYNVKDYAHADNASYQREDRDMIYHLYADIKNVMQRDGYTFVKWSTNDSCDDEVTSIPTTTGDLTFYACYSLNDYDVNYYTDETFTEVYDLNEGVYPYGYSHIVPNYVSEVLNQVFIYWMGNDSRVYLPGSTIVVEKDLKLYPVFYTCYMLTCS